MADRTRQAGMIVWLAALAAPPAVIAAGAALGQQVVTTHPVLAIVISVAYEAAVAIIGFVTGIFRELSYRWQVRFADKIDLFLQRKAARFERRYRSFVLERLRFMDHKGLPTVGPFTPELDAVFVNLSLAPRPPRQIGPGILPALADMRTGRRVLGDFIGREAPARLAVVGSPGSGKTTLLRHAARQACQHKRSWRNHGRHVRDIPVLLYLRDHAAVIITDPDVSLATLLRKTLGDVGGNEPPQWLEQRLREGRCLVLLDGLDEVALREDRAKVSAWAEGQAQQYPGNDFVISSRPQGYLSAPVEGAEILQVCGFTPSQVSDFVRSWYREIEQHSTTGPAADAHAAEGATDLLQRLERAPALYDLTVNPLLLTMITNVHRFRGALPGSRVELYSEICQAMLWRRQDAKKLAQQIAGEKKEGILRGLAYTMMRHRVSDLSRADVMKEIQPALRRLSRGALPEDFLDDVSANGLLIERETSQYAFAHMTFQEYLAAMHIRDRGLVSDLADAVNDDWWAETTLLYAARSNADPIIRACLDSGSAAALALALDCIVDQDSDVDPDLRARLDDLVDSAAGPDADQERRHLFAGILLSKHVRQRERTAGGFQVCARPIPADIYRLFLADTRTPAPDAPSADSEIAVGMRGSDAITFVQWANIVSGEQHGYRLPLAAELAGLAAQQRIPALPSGRLPHPWVQGSTGALPVLWLPPGMPAPYELGCDLLADAASEDMAHSVSTLTALLLLRSRILTRVLVLVGALNRDLDRALNLDTILDGVRKRVRDPDPDLGRDLDSVLGNILEHARDLDLDRVLDGATRDRDLDLERVRGHIRDFGLDRVRDLVRDFDLDRVRDRDVDRVRDRIRNPGRVGDLALAVALALDRELDETFSHNLPLQDIYVGIRSIFTMACGLVMGRAFSDAVTELPLVIEWDAFSARVAVALVDAAGVNANGRLTADPATLEATLREAVNGLAGAIDNERSSLLAASLWPAALAGQLSRDAGPVFSRAEPPVPEQVAAIRMAALRQAAEADAAERTDIGDMFRQVAAGITLLERRRTTVHAAEVIMLAVDQPALPPPS